MFLTKQEITQNKKKKEIKELVNPINITTNRMHWWGTLGAPWWPYNAYCSFKSVNECNLWDKQTLNLFLKICVTHLDSLTNWGGRMYFFYYLFLTCVSSHGQKRLASQRRGAGRKDTSLFPKIKDRKEQEKKNEDIWSLHVDELSFIFTLKSCEP